MKLNQKGFSVLHVVLLVVVVGIIAGTGWYVYSSNQKTNESLSNADASNNVDAKKIDTKKSDEWQTYKNEEAKITFSYPNNWQHLPNEVDYFENKFGGVSGDIVSPTGKKLHWAFVKIGGGGGDCEPESDDVPFAENNVCPSCVHQKKF